MYVSCMCTRFTFSNRSNGTAVSFLLLDAVLDARDLGQQLWYVEVFASDVLITCVCLQYRHALDCEIP